MVKDVNTQPLMQKHILSYDVYKHTYIYILSVYIILSQYPTMSSMYIYVYLCISHVFCRLRFILVSFGSQLGSSGAGCGTLRPEAGKCDAFASS